MQKIQVYSGKDDAPPGKLGHAAGVVLSLMEDYLDKGYTLYTDNYYNSVPLTEKMTEHSTYLCGTLRFDRRNNPNDVVKKKLKRGESTWKRANSVVVCKWKDKRDVLTISNKHQVEMVDVTIRNGKMSKKPNIVKDYNNGMSGVDRSDQMLSYYSCPRKTLRWYNKIGLHIFEIMLHNAHIIFGKILDKNMTILKFREGAVIHLLGEKFPKDNRIGKELDQSNLAHMPHDVYIRHIKVLIIE